MRSLLKKTVAQTRAIRRSSLAIVLSLTAVAVVASPASAINAGAAGSLAYQIKQERSVIDVVVVRRGSSVHQTTVVGPRDNVTSRTVVRGGAVPAPGYCWYYTDPGRTQGFWDVCPS